MLVHSANTILLNLTETNQLNQALLNCKYPKYSVSKYVKNYICFRMESWRVTELSRLLSLNAALIIAGYQD